MSNFKNKINIFKSDKNGISFIERVVFWIKNIGFTKHILFTYLLITFIGSGILMLPISRVGHKSVDYIDALFISASSFSDTGLVTVNTVETWTMFGQAVIAILILTGGIGFFALKIFIFNIIFNKPISLSSRKALSAERGNVKIGQTRDLIKASIIALITMMTFAGFVMSIYFYFSPTGFNEDFAAVGNFSGKSLNPKGNWNLSIRYGLFHSLSALNNAGFDIMGGHSIAPYYKDYFVQIMFMILFVFGGIGYPVIYDVKRYIQAKRKGQIFKFSLFTKLSCVTYFIIATSGIAITFIIELSAHHGKSGTNTFWTSSRLYFDGPTPTSQPISAPITHGQKTLAIIFNTMSTRNAGFSTINFHSFNTATLIVHSIMMFIGSAPSSTAGGIRTTTLAIICISFWTHVRGKSTTRAFKRKINEDIVRSSYIVTTISLFLILFVSMISLSSLDTNGGQIRFGSNYNPTTKGNPQYAFTDLLFETSSAFGTTGLSTGLTASLSMGTKLFFILLMFIGQLGVSSTILAFGTKKQKSRHYKYIEEDVTIG